MSEKTLSFENETWWINDLCELVVVTGGGTGSRKRETRRVVGRLSGARVERGIIVVKIAASNMPKLSNAELKLSPKLFRAGKGCALQLQQVVGTSKLPGDSTYNFLDYVVCFFLTHFFFHHQEQWGNSSRTLTTINPTRYSPHIISKKKRIIIIL